MNEIEINKRYVRTEDMSPDGTLTVIFQPDGDGVVSVCNEKGHWSTVEFCSPGSGGGRSPNTLRALRELALAIEKDNQERPIL